MREGHSESPEKSKAGKIDDRKASDKRVDRELMNADVEKPFAAAVRFLSSLSSPSFFRGILLPYH